MPDGSREREGPRPVTDAIASSDERMATFAVAPSNGLPVADGFLSIQQAASTAGDTAAWNTAVQRLGGHLLQSW